MSNAIRFLIPSTLLACGLVVSMQAQAALRYTYINLNPAAACQLSIPTTDTQVRPKATGYRNEGLAKGAFVICGFGTPTDDGTALNASLYFHSIDGVSRDISCTAVTGTEGLSPLVYSTKTVSSTAAGNASAMVWTDYDFAAQGTPFHETIRDGSAVSVTCSLPPQTSITLTNSKFQIEIGS